MGDRAMAQIKTEDGSLYFYTHRVRKRVAEGGGNCAGGGTAPAFRQRLCAADCCGRSDTRDGLPRSRNRCGASLHSGRGG